MNNFWELQPPTISGITSGFPQVHDGDIQSSIELIKTFEDTISGYNSAIDIAGGIGRISKELLVPIFSTVDLLDQSLVQINQAMHDVPEVRHFYNIGAQQFTYEHIYDCIWI